MLARGGRCRHGRLDCRRLCDRRLSLGGMLARGGRCRLRRRLSAGVLGWLD
jgi:hypothetical protein